MGVLNTNTGEVFFNLNKSFSVKGKHQFRSSKQKPAYANLMIRFKQYRYLNPKGFFFTEYQNRQQTKLHDQHG